MSVWEDVRLVPDFLCVTVPDEIDYPMAVYTSFGDLAEELRKKGALERLGIAGMNDMSAALLKNLSNAFGCELVDSGDILINLRKVKSENEIACLKGGGSHCADRFSGNDGGRSHRKERALCSRHCGGCCQKSGSGDHYLYGIRVR